MSKIRKISGSSRDQQRPDNKDIIVSYRPTVRRPAPIHHTHIKGQGKPIFQRPYSVDGVGRSVNLSYYALRIANLNGHRYDPKGVRAIKTVNPDHNKRPPRAAAPKKTVAQLKEFFGVKVDK